MSSGVPQGDFLPELIWNFSWFFSWDFFRKLSRDFYRSLLRHVSWDSSWNFWRVNFLDWRPWFFLELFLLDFFQMLFRDITWSSIEDFRRSLSRNIFWRFSWNISHSYSAEKIHSEFLMDFLQRLNLGIFFKCFSSIALRSSRTLRKINYWKWSKCLMIFLP